MQMADDETSTEGILRKWGIPESVIDRFKENEIQQYQLKHLSDDFLKELCPLIGHRLLVKSKIEEYFTAHTDTATTFTNSHAEDDLGVLGDTLDDIPIENLFSPTRPPFPEFDLKTLLSTSPHGNSIIAYYASHSTLTNKHRNQLVDIIVRHIFTRIVNYKITHEEYNLITGKIIVLFPKETSGTYFVPPVKKRESISGKPVFARGKLVDKIRNTLYKSGEKRKTCIETDQQEDVKKSKFIAELKDKQEDKIAFLKNNTEPWAQVIDYWIATYSLREYSKHRSVLEFLEEWNVLNDPRGDVLINLDFEEKYKENSLNFYTKWQKFINTIISLKFDNETKKDDSLASLYEGIIHESDDDRKVPDQIKLLCHLIPPKGRLDRKNKFSTLECIENFIVDVDNFGDIEIKIADLEKKTRSQKQTLQPFLIRSGTIGEDNIIYYYLVIDKVKYRFESATKAFDTLFKSYHALHASYPKAAAHLYLLIQRCVYGFETSYDKVVPYISDMLTLAKM